MSAAYRTSSDPPSASEDHGWSPRKQVRERTFRRLHGPVDVATGVAFLASDRAQHAVGVEITVSGGQLIA
jgi:NAD(P)-dependent dehydrogenase (short-subunit alcohol dehydrogenase family)